MTISIEIDREADAAYIRLSDAPTLQTVYVSPDVNVDTDTSGLAVGIELLTLNAEIPYDALLTEHHVHPEVIETLRNIRNSTSTVSNTGRAAAIDIRMLER